MSRVLLGMSGGVDSSTSAYLLKSDGHDVVAVTFLFHGLPQEKEYAQKAAEVCKMLGIEHHIVDARERFFCSVTDPFVKGYQAGKAPDPCSLCTPAVKIPLLFEQADLYDCREVATGHYATVRHQSGGFETYPIQLCMASHKEYDQSFYFYELSQDQLNRLMFPLSDMYKHDVRKLAMRQGLGVAQLERPNEPCFLNGMTPAQWLDFRREIESPHGDIIDISSGKKIGSHKGLHHYRIGDEAIDGLRVIEMDPERKELLVGADNLVGFESCLVENVHWCSIYAPKEKRSCRIRLHVAGRPLPCQLVPNANGTVSIAFNKPIESIMPGQTVVFYSDDMVLGGGTVR